MVTADPVEFDIMDAPPPKVIPEPVVGGAEGQEDEEEVEEE
jgi:hypothetical protein